MGKLFKLLAAVHLFLIKNNKILLARRFNTGYEDGNYSVPAGHIDGGEKVTDALIRETKEEIGINLNQNGLKIVHVMHRIQPTDERIDFFFECKKWKRIAKIIEPDKCDDLKWFFLSKLPDNTVPYVKQAITHYRNGVFFSEFGF